VLAANVSHDFQRLIPLTASSKIYMLSCSVEMNSGFTLRQNPQTMSQYKDSDDRDALSPEQMHRRLSQLGLVLCENDKIVIRK
jgi:hypothetical protein